MNVLDTLRTLAEGMRPRKGLLHNCRFEGLGIETYGIEAIVERIGMAPFQLSAHPTVVQTSDHIAVFDGERAVFADAYDGNIGRLWMLGPDGFGGEETVIAVPFDPDLDQAGGDVLFGQDDHPDLATDAVPQVLTAGRAIIAGAGSPRARAFAIRAFGTAAAGAVLFAVFRLRPEQMDVAGFHLMAARWDADGQQIVRDFGSEAALAASRWCPRIGVERGA